MDKNSNSPMISIIVPVYKVEKYLDRCLKSIVNQTYKNIEIILVDDGSPDRCPLICEEWAKRDTRIKVIHKSNEGLGAARNTGLKNATGKYVGFVDSDDWIALDMYEVLYNSISESNASIAVGNIVKVSSESINEKKSSGKKKICNQHEFAMKFFRINSNEPVLYAVNKLYALDVAQKMHFPEGVIDEDVEGTFSAILYADRIVTIDKDVYYYWQNQNGISAKWFSKKQMDLLTVWKNVVQLCECYRPDWKEYAELNYYRANMGLLIRLALNDREEDELYIEEEKILVRGLKDNRRKLLKAPLPASRKIIIMLFCVNHKFAKKMIRGVQQILKTFEC